MRIYVASTLLLLSGLSQAKSYDTEEFVDKYNKIFDGVTAVCDSQKAPAPEENGYHLAEATTIDGAKKILRVPQNTLGQLKKDGDHFIAEFHSYRWNKKQQTSKTEKSFLKLELENGVQRLNMYDINHNFQAGHAIGYADDGSIEFISSSTTTSPKYSGLENANKDAIFYLYVIRASKSGDEINYAINDVIFSFPKEIREKEEAESGKKFFSDKLDQNGTSYLGNTYSIEEIRAMAEKHGISPDEKAEQPWKNCPAPTNEEILDYQGKISRIFKHSDRRPSSKTKSKNK